MRFGVGEISYSVFINIKICGMKNLIVLLLILLPGCQSENIESKIEKWKAEVANAEKAFCDMAQKEGLARAFEYYAAEDGVLRRRNKIVKGKVAIANWYKDDVKPNETLVWKPTYIDVSESGDLAYTYGNFTFTYPDTLGNMKQNNGIFHTVWKRQDNGEWRYVWD